MINLNDLCKCSRCEKNTHYKELNQEKSDGKLICQSCGNELAVIDSIVINTSNQTNKLKIDEFNKSYNENIILDSGKDSYTEFVETTQFVNRQNRLKQIMGFTIYSLLIFLAYIILFIISLYNRNKRSASYDKEINALAEMYYYVPEMAFMKILEIVELRKVFKCESDIVLDVGGGSGFVFDVLTNGLKIKKKINIDLFVSDFKKYDYIFNEDINKNSLKDNSIDTVVSVSVLEHIPNIGNVYKSIYRILKHGSSLIFTTPKKDYHEGLVLYRFFHTFNQNKADWYKNFDIKKAHHCSIMNKDELLHKLENAGFKNIKINEFFPNRLHLLFDLINLPAKLPREYHFWSELYLLTYRSNLIKNIMVKFLISLLKIVIKIDLSHKRQSHYRVSCEK